MIIFGMLKNVLVAILVMVLMFSVTVFVYSNSIKATLLQPDFYEAQLEEIDGYQKLQSGMLDFFMDVAPAEQLDTFGISQLDLRLALANQISTSWIKTEVDKMTKTVLWYLTGETPGISIKISLRPKISAAFSELVSSKLGVSASDAQTLIDPIIGDNVPDPIDVLAYAPEVKSGLDEGRTYVMMFKQYTGLLIYVILAILVVLYLLTLDPKSFATIIGWPLLATGVLTAGGAYMLPNTVSSFASQMLGGIELPAGLTIETLVALLQPLFNDIIFQSIILAIIGVILIAFTYFYGFIVKEDKKKKKEKN